MYSGNIFSIVDLCNTGIRGQPYHTNKVLANCQGLWGYAGNARNRKKMKKMKAGANAVIFP